MSTVGLGDFHPRSNKERFAGAFFLLFGVALNSFVVENLNQMLKRMNETNKNFEEAEKLSHFIGTLGKFNKDVPIEKESKEKIEKYFEYRWKHYKNVAISTKEDEELLEQLPMVVRTEIYTNYLYKDFMRTYKRYFDDL